MQISDDGPVDIPQYVPARILNEFVYCPRLAYIEWVQGEFADNYETVDGRFRHRATDQEEGALPAPEEETEAIHAKSVWLSAPQEKLTSKIDLIEGTGESVTPVDYKRGEVPDTPERSWEADRIQLCAQGLILRGNGYTCDSGVIYYIASKTRVKIDFDENLIAKTRQFVNELRRVAESGNIPPPLEDSPKCVGCSLTGICLPDETNFFAENAGDAKKHDEPTRRLVPARDDSLPLYVQEQGAFITKKGELLEIKKKDAKIGEARMFETSQVSIFGNVQVSTQALREMCAAGIPLCFFSTGGWFYGMAQGMHHKNVELRRKQYATANDKEMSTKLGASFVAAKIENCRTMLRRNHPELTEQAAAELSRLADNARKERAVESLLGIEGMAARIYFSNLAGMLKVRDDANLNFDFEQRSRRPPRDPVNAMLSYAYSLLVKDLAITAMSVGFDPFLGFYHKPRYGRPALALDLMEEFRPIIADSVVIGVVNNRVLKPDDFIRRGPSAAMKPEARKKFISAYEKRLDSLVTHPVFGYRISYRRVLEVQTRLLARVLTGEIGEYPSFRTR